MLRILKDSPQIRKIRMLSTLLRQIILNLRLTMEFHSNNYRVPIRLNFQIPLDWVILYTEATDIYMCKENNRHGRREMMKKITFPINYNVNKPISYF